MSAAVKRHTVFPLRYFNVGLAARLFADGGTNAPEANHLRSVM